MANKFFWIKPLIILLLALLTSFLGCASERGKQKFSSLSSPLKSYSLPPIAGGMAERLKKNLDLSLVLKLAWKRNPSIQSARMRWRASIEKIPQATSYPDPLLSYSYYAQEVETRVGPQRHAVTLKQKIPFPGKLTLKGDVVAHQVDIERLKTERTLRDVVVQVKVAYDELFYIQRARELYDKQKELLQRYVAFAAGEHGKNRIKFNETFKAQSFLAQMGYEEVILKEMEISQKQILRSLLNLPLSVVLGKAKSMAFTSLKGKIPELVVQAEKHNEEILMALKKIEKAQSALSLAKMSHLPDFTVGVKWVETGKSILNTPESGKDPLILTAGINLPIWWARDSAKIDEKTFSLRGEKQQLQAVRQAIRAKIAKTYFQLTNSERLTRLYREQLIPQARQTLVVAERRYREKVSNFAAVLETTSVWFNFQLAYWRALTDYNQNRARMERLTGRVMR